MIPIIMYEKIDSIVNLGPYSPPTNRMPNVCIVTGTGLSGIKNFIWENKYWNTINRPTNEIVLSMVFELINLSISAFSLLNIDFIDIFFESDLIFFTVIGLILIISGVLIVNLLGKAD